ncbi:PREDICTED: translation initiation factor IF-2-like [Lepidothrix coronata]|uniref:Translation initiation factor IF-2-like n=1 Tax=Lepidothrix coronata TaxID=321398 RepID=A0A6J0HGH2_9PASS|nr:PREDICTED: translation initiation factor IF-2-like [Lepidothrix coronata]
MAREPRRWRPERSENAPRNSEGAFNLGADKGEGPRREARLSRTGTGGTRRSAGQRAPPRFAPRRRKGACCRDRTKRQGEEERGGRAAPLHRGTVSPHDVSVTTYVAGTLAASVLAAGRRTPARCPARSPTAPPPRPPRPGPARPHRPPRRAPPRPPRPAPLPPAALGVNKVRRPSAAPRAPSWGLGGGPPSQGFRCVCVCVYRGVRVHQRCDADCGSPADTAPAGPAS